MSRVAVACSLWIAASILAESTELAGGQRRYGTVERPRGLAAKSNRTFKVTLINNHDINYYGQVSMGRPAQLFMVMFDNTKDDLWLTSKRSPNASTWSHQVYDSSRSSTSKADGRPYSNQLYGSNNTGVLTVDALTLGDHPSRPLVSADQTFGELININVRLFSSLPFDGVLGLSNRRLTRQSGAPSPLQNMLDRQLLERPQFSLFLSADPAAKPQGELLFGGDDPGRHSGDITHAQVTSPEAWQFKVDRILLRNKLNETILTVCRSACRATISMVDKLISGPDEDIEQMYSLLSGSRRLVEGNYELADCDLGKLPSLVLVLNGAAADELVVAPGQYTERAGTDANRRPVCLSNVGHRGDNIESDGWNLGLTFLKAYYTIFTHGNEQQLAFARPNQIHASESSQVNTSSPIEFT